MKLEATPRQRYFLNRLKWYALTLVTAITLTFVLPRLGPVDPVDVILSKVNKSGLASAEIKAMEDEYRREFNLDKPVWRQYFIYLGQTLKGDLGTSSINYPNKCWDMIKSKIPWSLLLILPPILLAWFLGNLLGALAAYRRGLFDRVLYPLSLFLSAAPFFCFGLILVFVFHSKLGWVDELGAYSQSMEPAFTLAFAADVLAHYRLPFASIFLIMLGGQAIGMRSLAIYELGTDYVKYAKALGVKETKILLYVFRNAMLPQLTGLALILGSMLGGTLITELIFSYPGLGDMMLKAVAKNDFPLIQAIALLIAVVALTLNFAVDILIGVFDPRVRAGQSMEGGR